MTSLSSVLLLMVVGVIGLDPVPVQARSTYNGPFQRSSQNDENHTRLRLVELTDGQGFSEPMTNRTPVVFWHGMGDTAFGSIDADRRALQRLFPGIRVFSIQIGSSSIEDEMAGYFSNMNDQVSQACQQIFENPIIRSWGSFHAVGFSQGAQFLRAAIQRCSVGSGIKVKNFISLGGQHQGVFGLPNCVAGRFCDYIRYMLSNGAYLEEVQNHLVQAQYWHDPLHEDSYREKNIFLADINNENALNETYRSALLSLDNLVLVEFLNDDMVVPRESSLFGFYEPGQTNNVLPLEQTELYKQDRLGLQELLNNDRLKLIRIPGGHLQYSMKWFLDKLAAVYLK